MQSAAGNGFFMWVKPESPRGNVVIIINKLGGYTNYNKWVIYNNYKIKGYTDYHYNNPIIKNLPEGTSMIPSGKRT
jgi:hypothetical protein